MSRFIGTNIQLNAIRTEAGRREQPVSAVVRSALDEWLEGNHDGAEQHDTHLTAEDLVSVAEIAAFGPLFVTVIV